MQVYVVFKVLPGDNRVLEGVFKPINAIEFILGKMKIGHHQNMERVSEGFLYTITNHDGVKERYLNVSADINKPIVLEEAE